MINRSIFSFVLSFLMTSLAVADDFGPFDFSFTGAGGAIPAIDPDHDSEGVSVFSLTMANPSIPHIASLELLLNGLTHSEPADLDIYLIDPFGRTLEVMTDRGDAVGIVQVDLIFNDKAAGLPPLNSQLSSGTYLTEGPGGLGNFVGGSGGTDAWVLVIIDDSATDSGSLQSWTLRGTVPEPMTLSLLALGGLALLRRRRA